MINKSFRSAEAISYQTERAVLHVPVDRFIDGYQSRSERVANLMRMMHICENKSGWIDYPTP
jgi:hypothetical protein